MAPIIPRDSDRRPVGAQVILVVNLFPDRLRLLDHVRVLCLPLLDTRWICPVSPAFLIVRSGMISSTSRIRM